MARNMNNDQLFTLHWLLKNAPAGVVKMKLPEDAFNRGDFYESDFHTLDGQGGDLAIWFDHFMHGWYCTVETSEDIQAGVLRILNKMKDYQDAIAAGVPTEWATVWAQA